MEKSRQKSKLNGEKTLQHYNGMLSSKLVIPLAECTKSSDHFFVPNKGPLLIDLTYDDDSDYSPELECLISPRDPNSPKPTIDEPDNLIPVETPMVIQSSLSKRISKKVCEYTCDWKRASKRIKSMENTRLRKRIKIDDDKSDRKLVKCAECGQSVANNSDCIRNHVSFIHLKQPMFKCSGCGKSWLSVKHASLARIHVENMHKSDDQAVKYLDYRPRFANQMKQLVSELFGGSK